MTTRKKVRLMEASPDCAFPVQEERLCAMQKSQCQYGFGSRDLKGRSQHQMFDG